MGQVADCWLVGWFVGYWHYLGEELIRVGHPPFPNCRMAKSTREAALTQAMN
jgi:hypothetical protein